MSALIDLQGVTRRYGTDASAGVFDIDLEIHSGEYIVIVGASGAGKSTLLQLIGLLDVPDEGSYCYQGADMLTVSERERDKLRATSFGFVFQASHVLPHLSAHANAALGMVPNAVPLDERSQRAYRALQRLNIASRAQTPAGVLSGGERQRLAIARALATGPAVVLADEPTGSLDSRNGERVLEDLEGLHELGATVIIITHDEKVAERAHRTIRIVDGRIVEDTGPNPPSTRHTDEPVESGVEASSAMQRRPKNWRVRAADVVSEALTEVLLRRIRTGFLVLAFALGIGGLVTSVGLSQTAAVQITDQLDAAAFDEVRITLPEVAPDQLREQLVESRERTLQLPHLEYVTASVQLPLGTTGVSRLQGDTEPPTTQLQLIAVDDSFFAANDLTLSQPHRVELFAASNIATVAVVGAEAQRALQLPSSGEDGTLVVGGHYVQVVDTFTTGDRRPGLDNAILVPLSLLSKLPSGQAELLIRTEPGYAAAIAEAAPLQLDAAEPGKYRVQTVADLRNLRFGVATDLDALVGIMAVTLLVLATVSASTSMYLSVLARSSEIALRRALGLSRSGVAARFLVEGVLIGAIGGALGALGGVMGVLLVSMAQGWEAQISPWLVPLSMGIGVISGLTSAVVPAVIASRQPPSSAL